MAQNYTIAIIPKRFRVSINVGYTVHGDKDYEGEFVTLRGETVAVVSVRAEQLRSVEPREIAHVRAVG